MTNLYNETKSIVDSKEVITVGDFKNPGVGWNTLTGGHKRERLINLVEDTSLNQLVNTLTLGNNILDLVLATDSDLTDLRYARP